MIIISGQRKVFEEKKQPSERLYAIFKVVKLKIARNHYSIISRGLREGYVESNGSIYPEIFYTYVLQPDMNFLLQYCRFYCII